MRKQIELLNHQKEFIISNNRHTGLVAGFGGGKTYSAVVKIVLKKLEYVGIDVAYYLPTYNLIKDIAVPRISEFLDVLGLTYTVNLSDKFFDVYNGGESVGRIIMRTMDNPSLIVGYEVGYSLIDECDVLPKHKMNTVFKQVLARNRSILPNNAVNQTDVVGTPEGFKWFYEFFVTKNTNNKTLVRAKTTDNPFLSDSYLEGLLEDYTGAEIDAYINGEFVNLTTGSVYRNFDRKENHSSREIKDTDVLHIGMDFNITNMSAVIHVIDNDKPIAVEEIVDVYDTQEMIGVINDRYSNHSIVVYPDASSGARKTSGGSDLQLLERARFTIRRQNKNSSVKNRVTIMNVCLLNNKGERKYKVNTNNCPRYTESLEKQAYDKRGVPDKQGGYDHLCDAGGYFIYTNETKIKLTLKGGSLV